MSFKVHKTLEMHPTKTKFSTELNIETVHDRRRVSSHGAVLERKPSLKKKIENKFLRKNSKVEKQNENFGNFTIFNSFLFYQVDL